MLAGVGVVGVGAKLALSWGIWAQELALDGLVGLREAIRSLNFFI